LKKKRVGEGHLKGHSYWKRNVTADVRKRGTKERQSSGLKVAGMKCWKVEENEGRTQENSAASSAKKGRRHL